MYIGMPVSGNQYYNTYTPAASDMKPSSAGAASPVECQTCKNRKYQDGSNDPSVSFKAPGYISPQASAYVVRAHEQEHVSNERGKAAAEGREVISQSVSLQTAVCPECGRSYVAGGKTVTVTKSKEDRGSNDFFTKNFNKSMNRFFGSNLDVKV